MEQGHIRQLLTAPQGQMSESGQGCKHSQACFCQAQAVPKHQVFQLAQTLDVVQPCISKALSVVQPCISKTLDVVQPCISKALTVNTGMTGDIDFAACLLHHVHLHRNSLQGSLQFKHGHGLDDLHMIAPTYCK